ncbi:hypothetical protein KR009_012218 [Drosophila setifemur]|nr:hypothetical protein KR009_012218 [Drosophila setifemur]
MLSDSVSQGLQLAVLVLILLTVRELIAKPLGHLDSELPANNTADNVGDERILEDPSGSTAPRIFQNPSTINRALYERPTDASLDDKRAENDANKVFRVFSMGTNGPPKTEQTEFLATTKKDIRLYADPQGAQGANTKRKEFPGGRKLKVSDVGNTARPYPDTDEYGSRVYNPWAATFGLMEYEFGQPRIRVLKRPLTDYYDPYGKNISGVCKGRTINPVMQEYREDTWFEPHRYKRVRRVYAVLWSIRRYIFANAISEECHKPNMKPYNVYLECAIRRNKRMEWYVPYYPFHVYPESDRT